MVTSLALYWLLLALVALERLLELWLSRRNAARAFAAGAVEVGRRHYRVMTAFHTVFLLSCAVEPWLLDRAFPGAVGWLMLGVVGVAQGLRYWAIATLGWRWNTRIIVLPEAEPITTGPYRYVKHPNYLAVVLELLALPLVHGAWLTAIVFSVGNAAILFIRIRAEEAALGRRWAEAFAGRPRFIGDVRRA